MGGITFNKITGAAKITGAEVLSLLWVPLMFAAFFTFGLLLLFIPNLMLHWRLLRRGAA